MSPPFCDMTTLLFFHYFASNFVVLFEDSCCDLMSTFNMIYGFNTSSIGASISTPWTLVSLTWNSTPSTLHGTPVTQSRLILVCMIIVVCFHPLTITIHLSKVLAMPKWWCTIWLPPYPLPIMPAMPKWWWEVWFASYA